MSIFIKRISHSPVRYLLYQQGKMNDHLAGAFSSTEKFTKTTIGVTTFRTYFSQKIFNFQKEYTLIDESVEVSDCINSLEMLQQIVKSEEENLLTDMYAYMSKKETSPVKLEDWLRQRGISSKQRKTYLEIAQKKNFLSLERYVEMVIEKKFRHAKQPWWLVAKTLTYELEQYNYLLNKESKKNFTSLKEFIDAFIFDDEEMLKKNFLTSLPLPNISKLKKSLLSKGFSYRVVDQYIEYLGSKAE